MPHGIILPPVMFIFAENLQFFYSTYAVKTERPRNNGHFARRNLDCVGLTATFFFLPQWRCPSSHFVLWLSTGTTIRPGQISHFHLRVEPVRARKASRSFLEGFDWHFGSVVAADGYSNNLYCTPYILTLKGSENSDCILCMHLSTKYSTRSPYGMLSPWLTPKHLR